MSTIAAFYWKANNDKSYLSYMILDEGTLQPCKLEHVKCGKYDGDHFEDKAGNAIHNFFSWINEINLSELKIRYKIVAHASPVWHLSKGCEASSYIDKTFQRLLKENELEQKVQILKSDLDGERLKAFKDALQRRLPERKCETYEHRVWAVALHVTPTEHEKVIKLLNSKPILSEMKEGERLQAKKKPN